jgi:class 3 adenylate cyclase
MSSGQALPSGTVTFLFTDIEGSTRLVKALGDRYEQVLAEHQGILREAFAEQHGHEVDTQGDCFFVAFRRARDAINCAVAAQRELATADWPRGAAVKVRMGIHTGEPVLGEQRYTSGWAADYPSPGGFSRLCSSARASCLRTRLRTPTSPSSATTTSTDC